MDLLLTSPTFLVFYELYLTARKLLGHGDPPHRPDAPAPSDIQPGTNNPNEKQAHDNNKDDGGQLEEHSQQGKQAADAAKNEIDAMKKKLDDLFDTVKGNVERTNNGGAPDTDLATNQVMRDGVRDMRDLVGNAADQAAGRAAGLPMPNLGALANPLGVGGGGLPGAGMLGGGMPAGAAGFNPFAPPPEPISQQGQTVPNPFTDAPTDLASHDHTQHTPAATDHPDGVTSAEAASQQHAPNGPRHTIITDPSAPNSREVVAHDGTKTTAPDTTAATVLRHAVDNPNSANMTEAAYAAANITLPGNGADPGKDIDISDIQPGDIVRFADHDALVFGDGKVLSPDGGLQSIGDAINAGFFKGIFRVERATTTSTSNENNTPTTQPNVDNG
jgi:hypothetical protein